MCVKESASYRVCAFGLLSAQDKKLGAAAYLQKPVTADRLLEVIDLFVG